MGMLPFLIAGIAALGHRRHRRRHRHERRRRRDVRAPRALCRPAASRRRGEGRAGVGRRGGHLARHRAPGHGLPAGDGPRAGRPEDEARRVPHLLGDHADRLRLRRVRPRLHLPRLPEPGRAGGGLRCSGSGAPRFYLQAAPGEAASRRSPSSCPTRSRCSRTRSAPAPRSSRAWSSSLARRGHRSARSSSASCARCSSALRSSRR